MCVCVCVILGICIIITIRFLYLCWDPLHVFTGRSPPDSQYVRDYLY